MIRLNVKPAGVVSVKIGAQSIGMTVVKAVLGEGGHKPSEGDYVVTPKVEAQMLETENKIMEQNVSIMGIPYYDVSNSAGGNTIYIGSEVLTYGN